MHHELLLACPIQESQLLDVTKPQVTDAASWKCQLHVMYSGKQVEPTWQCLSNSEEPQVRVLSQQAPKSPHTPHATSSKSYRIEQISERARSGAIFSACYPVCRSPERQTSVMTHSTSLLSGTEQVATAKCPSRAHWLGRRACGLSG